MRISGGSVKNVILGSGKKGKPTKNGTLFEYLTSDLCHESWCEVSWNCNECWEQLLPGVVLESPELCSKKQRSFDQQLQES